MLRWLPLLAAPALAVGVARFGPKHCVSVARSDKTGTCVLRTNCEGLDLEQVEFSFTCQLPGVLQKHSFGKGGFDAIEEFDTSVKCDSCGLPQEVARSLKKAAFLNATPTKVLEKTVSAAVVQKETTTTTTTTVIYPSVSYGPGNCIETWLKTDNATVTAGVAAAAPAVAVPAAAPAGSAPPAEAPPAETPPAEAPPAEAPPAEAPAFLQSNTTATDGEKGVCFVRTRCSAIADDVWQEYPVGVIALDRNGVPVRHLFGRTFL